MKKTRRRLSPATSTLTRRGAATAGAAATAAGAASSAFSPRWPFGFFCFFVYGAASFAVESTIDSSSESLSFGFSAGAMFGSATGITSFCAAGSSSRVAVAAVAGGAAVRSTLKSNPPPRAHTSAHAADGM